MQAFDRLPKIVRAALGGSQFNWNVEQLCQDWLQKRMTARQLVKHIRSEDRIRLFDRRIG